MPWCKWFKVEQLKYSSKVSSPSGRGEFIKSSVMMKYILEIVGGKSCHIAGCSQIDLPVEEITMVNTAQ